MSVVKELITLWGFEIDQKPLKELDTGLNTIKATLSNMGWAMAGVVASVGYLLNEAGEQEQTKIAFETMLGSAELAEQKLADLKAFALKTPFDLKGLTESSKKLLAYGFQADELIPTLDNLGNISAGVGREKLPFLILALGQVRAAGKLTGAELRQFTENGVPMLEELAKVLGKPVAEVQKMISDGKVGFPIVQKALANLTGEGGRFHNLMIKQSKSLLGLWSNFLDWVNMLAVELGDSLLPMAKEVMTQMLEWADANREVIKTNLVEFMGNVVDMGHGLINVLKAIYMAANPVAQAFGGWNSALDLVMNSFVALSGLGMVYGIGLITKALFGLAVAWRAMGTAAMWAQIKVMAIPLAIGAIVVAIALIAEDLLAFSQGRNSVFGLMMQGLDSIFSALKEKFGIFGQIGAYLMGALLTPLRAIINAIKSLGVLLDMVRGKRGFLDGMKAIAGNVGNTFGIGGPDGVTAGLGAMAKVNHANNAFEAGNTPMVGLGGGLEAAANAQAANGKSVAGVNNSLTLNVEGVAPENQMEMIKGTFMDQMSNMMRETMRDGEPQVER